MNSMIAISAICAFLLGSALFVSGGTWRDDFEDGDLAGWEEMVWNAPGGIWTVEDGQLILNRNDPWSNQQMLAGVVVDDVTMEYDVQVEQFLHQWLSVETWRGSPLGVLTISGLPEATCIGRENSKSRVRYLSLSN